jgi:hypothetical protein
VPGESHERVEVGRDPRVRGQVIPERPAEHLLVGRLAGADVVEQRSPGVRHPAADTGQVDKAARVRQVLRRLVARKSPGRVRREHATGNEVAEDGVQGVLVAPGRRGQLTDVMVASRDEFGDVQGSSHSQAPGSRQVQQLVQVHAVIGDTALSSHAERPGPQPHAISAGLLPS